MIRRRVCETICIAAVMLLLSVKPVSAADVTENIPNVFQYDGFVPETVKRTGKTMLSSTTSAKPAKVSGIRYTSSGSGKITIRWNKQSGVDGYRIYRAQAGESYKLIAKVAGADKVSYTDKTVVDWEVYEYTVAAYKGSTIGKKDPVGVYAVTSAKSGIYNLKKSSVAPDGFTLTGYTDFDQSAFDRAYQFKVAVWSENGGQDDLVWMPLTLRNGKFTVKVKASAHKGDTGGYFANFYFFTEDDTAVLLYSAAVVVPSEKKPIELTGPVIRSISSTSYTAAFSVRCFEGFSSASAEAYPASVGKSGRKAVGTSVSGDTVTVTVDAADFGGVKGTYYTTLTVRDLAHNELTYTYKVKTTSTPAAMRYTQIDVGHGDAGLLASDGEFLLIDCGRMEASDDVVGFLKLSGVEKLSVLITHRHDDHTGGLRAIADNFTIDHLYIDESYLSDYYCDEYTTQYGTDYVRDKGVPVSDIGVGEELTVGRASVKVLGPDSLKNLTYDGSSNANSKWLSITDGYEQFLVCGDTDKTVESEMLSKNMDFKSSFLKISHHGLDSGNSTEFLQTAAPQYTICSASWTTSRENGYTAVRNLLKTIDSTDYVTEKNGDVSLYDYKGTLYVYYNSAKTRLATRVTVPSLKKKSFTYSGSKQSISFKGLDTDYVTVSGTKSAVNAGKYTVKCVLKDKVHCTWPDGTTADKKLSWTIKKVSVPIPTLKTKSFTYNKKSHTVTVVSDCAELFTVGGKKKAVSAGKYSVTLTLNDTANYQWSDGTTEVKKLSWKINKASVPVPILSALRFVYNGKYRTVSVIADKAELITVSGKLKAKSIGTYAVTVTLNDTANYKWPDGTVTEKTLKWKITKTAFKPVYDDTDFSPVFDAARYAYYNPDVVKECGFDEQALFSHFVNEGLDQGRRACDSFNVKTYRANYPDLQAAFGKDWRRYYYHYIYAGIAEGRSGQ